MSKPRTTATAQTVTVACDVQPPAILASTDVGAIWPFVELTSDYTARLLVLHRELIGTIADQGDNRVKVTPRGKGGRGWLVRGSAGEVLAQVRRAFGCEAPTPHDRGGPQT